jgi:hypothetical protein
MAPKQLLRICVHQQPHGTVPFPKYNIPPQSSKKEKYKVVTKCNRAFVLENTTAHLHLSKENNNKKAQKIFND